MLHYIIPVALYKSINAKSTLCFQEIRLLKIYEHPNRINVVAVVVACTPVLHTVSFSKLSMTLRATDDTVSSLKHRIGYAHSPSQPVLMPGESESDGKLGRSWGE